MIKLRFHSKKHRNICPICKGSNTKRIRRSIQDHKYPKSRRYSCARCGAEYLHFAGVFSLIRRY